MHVHDCAYKEFAGGALVIAVGFVGAYNQAEFSCAARTARRKFFLLL
jgi:hypothetical protein